MSFITRTDLPDADALVVLGSGMGECYRPSELHVLEETAPSIRGHRGILGLHTRSRVLVSVGRRHLYEGLDVETVTATVERAARAGATRLVLANAAGGLDPRLAVEDIMAIVGVMPMMMAARLRPTGVPDEADCHGGLDARARRRAVSLALDRGVALQEGVYAAVLGPSYETRAEVRMLRRLGAHAVGMSTAPELLVARRLGLRCVALSLITNTLSDTGAVALDHAHVVAAGLGAAERMRIALDCALEALGVAEGEYLE